MSAIPSVISSSADRLLRALWQRLGAASAAADGEPEESAAAVQCPHSRAWLDACVATRKVWDSGATMSRVNPRMVRELKGLLATGSAQEIAKQLADIAGPTHPGDPKLAGEPWVAKAGLLLQASLEAFVGPAIALRDIANEEIDKMPRARKAQHPKTGVDLDDLKAWMVHWIEHGRLPDVLPVWFTRTASAARLQKLEAAGGPSGWAEAAAIASLLSSQGGSLQGAALRCAVIGAAAPALESALVMARMSDGYLQVLDAQQAQRDAAARKTQEELAKAMKSSPMYRDGRDDAMVGDAFRRMFDDPSELASRVGGFKAPAPEEDADDEDKDGLTELAAAARSTLQGQRQRS